MASDYSPPRLVKPTPGGNAGDGSLNGALTVQADVTKASLGPSAKTLIAMDSGGDPLIGSTDIGGGRLEIDPNGVFPNGMSVPPIYGSSASFSSISNGAASFAPLGGGGFSFNGPISVANGIGTKGEGFSPIYGLGSRVTVAATTSPGTTIATFTPGATGSFKVNVTVKNKDTTSVTANVLVSYTDPDVGAQSVLIINGVSIAASGVASAHFVLDSTATAITVSAYGSVADELVCTADIEQFA